MNLETYKKIEIESKLKELINSGISLEDAATYLVDNGETEDIDYIIEACLIPIDEIKNEIEISSMKFNETELINDLCKKYNVDKKIVSERIQNVRKIIKYEKIDTSKRLEMLKEKRDLLQKEKNKLNNKEMDIEEKIMYYYGLGVVTVVGGLLFYSSLPVLVGILPVVYAYSIPVIRMSEIRKREVYLINQLVDLGKEIEYLDNKVHSDEKVQILDNNYDYVNMSYNTINYDIEEKERVIEGPKLVKRRK